jgi:paraquat-inducible protein B
LPIERIAEEAARAFTALRELVAGPELRGAVANLSAATGMVRDLAPRLEAKAMPAIASLTEAADAAKTAAERAGRTVGSLEATIGPRAPLWGDVGALLRDLDGAVRGVRFLVEYLERHPDALIRGKSAPAP